MRLTERMDRFHETDLYAVITGEFCAGRTPVEVLDACLSAGVRIVQLREKELDTAALFDLAMAFRARTREAGALLIIDDRVDVALAVEADGVHLGLNDLPVDAARRIGPDLIIGASSHDLGEARSAEARGASYVNIGPIFATQTKAVASGVVGPEMITRIAAEITAPFTCMGGIKAENIQEVLDRGARHVAVVTAVSAASDVAGAARGLREVIRAARRD